jgi:adenylate cyclase
MDATIAVGTTRLRAVLSKAVVLALLTLAIAAALLLWLVDPIPLQNIRLAQFDQFQRWQPRPQTSSAVRVVDIDDASLKAFGQWPWPRTRMAELVQRLHASGASVVAFDVLLAEPDRTSPREVAQLWQNPQVSALLEELPDHDEVLARAMIGKSVVLGTSLSHEGGPDHLLAGGAESALALPYRVISSGDAGTTARWLGDFDHAVWPMPVLRANAAGLGSMNFAADSDGVVRRVPLLMGLSGQMVPSLSAEALRVAQGTRNYQVRSNEAGVQAVRIGALTVPTNAQAELWLHYPETQSVNFIPAMQVLNGTADMAQLQGRIVLLGSSAAGLTDLRFNPMGQLMPGVQAHALALEQVLSGQQLQRPSGAAGMEALVLVFGALLVGGVALVAPARWSALLTAGVLTSLMGGAWYAFTAQHLLLDAINPALAMLVSFVLASGVHHYASEREQRWIHQAFSRYVSPNRVAHLMAHPEQLQLSGVRQVCSFVFTDLQGFTSMMERSDPAQVVALLNEYLDAMLDIVFKHEGTLDRIMGDAVVVLFSAPVQQADHRQRALDCALEMDAFASRYAQELQARGVPWGHTRIGAHCGEVIVGNFGGKTLFDYRALGDPINTAARLESVNKKLGTRVCISQAILDGCPGAAVRAVGRLVLKGKSKPLQAYEPVKAAHAVDYADQSAYAAAMHLLQPGPDQNPELALEAFEKLASRHPQDPLVQLHCQRLREGATDDVLVLAEK